MAKTQATLIKVYDLCTSDAEPVTENITGDQIEMTGRVFGFNRQSVQKLINGPDRFNFIRGGGFQLYKRLVTPEEFAKLKLNNSDKMMQRTKAILAESETKSIRQEVSHD